MEDKIIVDKEKRELGFVHNFKSCSYKLDHFIDIVKKCLEGNGFVVTQEKIKTGEATTYAGGITLEGGVGGGAAKTRIETITWNPMHIELGINPIVKFCGSIKINSLSSFQRKIKNLNIDIGDYELKGGIIHFLPKWTYFILALLVIILASFIGIFSIVVVFIIGILIKKYSNNIAIKKISDLEERIKNSFKLVVEENQTHYDDLTNR